MDMMMVSPLHRDYVTKGEFEGFRGEVRDFGVDSKIRFDNIDYNLKDLKTFVDGGFEGMYQYIDNSFYYFEEKMNKRFDNIDQKFISLEEKFDGKFDNIERKINNITNLLTKTQ